MESIYITEKTDGMNTRIITFGDDWVIGTRDAIIYAKGDRILSEDNIKRSIIKMLFPIAEGLVSGANDSNNINVYYGESYGHGINGYKHYTLTGKHGFRLFDSVVYQVGDVNQITSMDKAVIAGLRDHYKMNGRWGSVSELSKIAENYKGYGLSTVPYLSVIDKYNNFTGLCKTLESAYSFMQQYISSKAALDDSDGDISKGYKRSEGVVVRNSNRLYIKKMRFEDYEKTFRRTKDKTKPDRTIMSDGSDDIYR